AACIDVCNDVMDKMSYPRGLIRYDTENGLAQHLSRAQRWRRVLRPRVLIYGAVLLLLSGAMLASLALRAPFRVDVLRDRAALARLVDEGQIENIYRLQIMNATELVQRYRVGVEGLPGLALAKPLELELMPAEGRWVALALRLPPDSAARAGAGAHPIHFEILRAAASGAEASAGDDARSVREKSTFVVPR
ncbi:MAG TPA: FixG Ig-like domain-containing protein, partial [Roseateles sp.]|nr:FixG Ig-like domain-containing protein [Roseateles sp.]